MLRFSDVIFEVALSFVIGGVPILIAYCLGGETYLAQVVEAIVPTGFPFWYAFAVSVASSLLLLAFKLKPSAAGTEQSFMKRVLVELHSDLHVIYRLAAGLLLTFSALWLYVGQAATGKIIAFLVLGAVCLAFCVGYGAFTRWLEKH